LELHYEKLSTTYVSLYGVHANPKCHSTICEFSQDLNNLVFDFYPYQLATYRHFELNRSHWELETKLAYPLLLGNLGYAFVVEYKRGLRIGWQMHFPGNLTLLLWTHSYPYNKKQVVCSFSQSLNPHGWLFSRIATLKTLLFSSLFLQFNLVLLPKALPSRMI